MAAASSDHSHHIGRQHLYIGGQPEALEARQAGNEAALLFWIDDKAC
jgi:glucan phosphoethanolaminetransferase (alkaline phosphatase superfamily)